MWWLGGAGSGVCHNTAYILVRVPLAILLMHQFSYAFDVQWVAPLGAASLTKRASTRATPGYFVVLEVGRSTFHERLELAGMFAQIAADAWVMAIRQSLVRRPALRRARCLACFRAWLIGRGAP